MRAPTAAPPADLASAGADLWSLRAFRELDDALLRLRFNEPEIAVVTLRTTGDAAQVLAHDAALAKDGRHQRLRPRGAPAAAPRAQAPRQHRALAVRGGRQPPTAASPACCSRPRWRPTASTC
jgi:hypothetical protein